jgi:hypothetical protein
MRAIKKNKNNENQPFLSSQFGVIQGTCSDFEKVADFCAISHQIPMLFRFDKSERDMA